MRRHRFDARMVGDGGRSVAAARSPALLAGGSRGGLGIVGRRNLSCIGNNARAQRTRSPALLRLSLSPYLLLTLSLSQDSLPSSSSYLRLFLYSLSIAPLPSHPENQIIAPAASLDFTFSPGVTYMDTLASASQLPWPPVHDLWHL